MIWSHACATLPGLFVVVFVHVFVYVHILCLHTCLHVYISAHFMCIRMQAWKCLCLCSYTQPIWPHEAALHWHVVDDRPGLMGMVISQVDLGIPWGMGSVWLSEDITRRHVRLHAHHKPMKMITFDTQMTFYPCCDNTGSFFCSDIRCCVGVIQVKSIILMEK